MQELLSNLSIQVDDHIFLKNPESSDLGKKIIQGGIELMDETGFEAFTFSKLAKRINSTEASIYRYFESKHKFLLFLTVWYWGWMEYRLVFALANILSPEDRISRAIHLLTEDVSEMGNFPHIDQIKLYRIVISESSKAYFTKEVDQENKEGCFSGYKRIVKRVSDIILEINPHYMYPHMLISTVIEGAHHQRYFAEHLPKLTDEIKDGDAVIKFYTEMVFKAIKEDAPNKATEEKT
jgi:AcrR family transcriptional regulator